jgi:hypothetical protein
MVRRKLGWLGLLTERERRWNLAREGKNDRKTRKRKKREKERRNKKEKKRNLTLKI